MDEIGTPAVDSPTGVETSDLPQGDHPLEMAARRGFGPLSPRAHEIWHGHAAPCVTCGQLGVRGAELCEYCGQDLTPEMIEKMRVHAGPWYVLEHVRPFPGVSLDRIIRQIHRGLLTETSIVRGPATDYQWRFAVETPGLCRLFHRCWFCHAEVASSETQCLLCSSHLTFDRPHGLGVARVFPAAAALGSSPAVPFSANLPAGAGFGAEVSSLELERLRLALSQASTMGTRPADAAMPLPLIRRVRPSWIVATILVIVALGLMIAVRLRAVAPGRINEPASTSAPLPRPAAAPQ